MLAVPRPMPARSTQSPRGRQRRIIFWHLLVCPSRTVEELFASLNFGAKAQATYKRSRSITIVDSDAAATVIRRVSRARVGSSPGARLPPRGVLTAVGSWPRMLVGSWLALTC